MMAGLNAGTVYASVRADTKKLKTDLLTAQQRVERAGKKIETTLKKSFAVMGVAAAAGAAVAIYQMQKVGREAIALAKIQEDAEKRLETVIKATGQAAGYNIDQLKNMASAMQQVTTVGDEVILGGMAILATFKNVREEAFERTTKVALDMSEVMGQDLKSSMVMIAKAMNDPIANLSAMSRAGVQFTKDQKDMVKQLWESGKQMEAQNVILKEMESQFGGVSEAMRNTFSGATKAAANALGDVKEEIGFIITKNQVFVELLLNLEKVFISWGDAIKDNKVALMDFAKNGIVAFASGMETAILAIGFLIEKMRTVSMVWLTTKKAFLSIEIQAQKIKLWANQGEVSEKKIRMELVATTSAYNDVVQALAATTEANANTNDAVFKLHAALGTLKQSLIETKAVITDHDDPWLGFSGLFDALEETGGGVVDVGDKIKKLTKNELKQLEKALEKIRKKALEAISEMSHIDPGDDYFGLWMIDTPLDQFVQKVKAANDAVEIDTKQTTDMTYDLWMRAMNRVEDGIADVFEDVFTGQFDSIEDAFDDMLDAMLRMLAEWAAAAAMFDIFGVGDGNASFSGLFSGGSSSGVGVSGGAGGSGWTDYLGSILSVGSKGYELYTGKSLIGQVYNFAAETLAAMLSSGAGTLGSTAIGSAGHLAGMGLGGAGGSGIAGSAGVGAGSGAGAMSGAAVGGIAAAAIAAIIGLGLVFRNNFMKGGATTLNTGTHITPGQDGSFLQGEMFDGWVNNGEWTNPEETANELAVEIGKSIEMYNVLFANLSEASQEAIKTALGDMDQLMLTVSQEASDGAPIEAFFTQGSAGTITDDEWSRVESLFDNRYIEYTDSFINALPSDLNTEQRDALESAVKAGTLTGKALADIIGVTYSELLAAFEGEYISAEKEIQYIINTIGQLLSGGSAPIGDGIYNTIPEAFKSVFGEAFSGYIAEALGNIKQMPIFDLMTQEIKDIFDPTGWSTDITAFTNSFNKGVDSLNLATVAYEKFQVLMGETTAEFTVFDKAMQMATTATAAHISALEALGEEVSEEEITAIAVSWGKYFTGLAGDLDALASPVTLLDEGVASLTAQFELTWKDMVDAGIDVEKLGDKTELLSQAIQNLTEVMQAEVWDNINTTVKALNSEVGTTEGTVSALISTFYDMWQALVQVNAASEDFVALQEMALETMKYQMGLGDGFDRKAQIDERYGGYDLSYQEMIDAFAEMDLSELKTVAEALGINWWDIAQDIGWLVDNIDDAGEVAKDATWRFRGLADSILELVQSIQEQIDKTLYISGGGSDTAYYYGKILSAKSDVEDLIAAADFEGAMEKLYQGASYVQSWYNAAVAEATKIAQDKANSDREDLNGQREALNEQLTVARAFAGLVDQIESTIQSIKYSTLNVSLPQEKAAQAQGDYEALKAAALASGDVDDYQKFVSFASTYLDQQQADLKSSQAYQNKYAMVMSDLEAAKGVAEAQSYDEAILAELEAIEDAISNIEVNVDLTAINDEFAILSAGINAYIDRIRSLDIILTIDWAEFDGDANDVLTMLKAVIDTYGTGSDITIDFILDLMDAANVPIANVAYWLGENGIGLTDLEIADITAKLIMELYPDELSEIPLSDLDAWLTDMGLDVETIPDITSKLIMEMYKDELSAIPISDMAAYLVDIGVTDAQIPDIMAKMIMELYPDETSALPIDDIDAYLTGLGITDAALTRSLTVNLLYQFAVSGDYSIEDIANWAHAKVALALVADEATKKTILEQVIQLGTLFGVENSYNLGSRIAEYGTNDTLSTPAEWAIGGQAFENLVRSVGLSYEMGGMAYGPESGYLATLHGDELIVSPKSSYPATVIPNGGSTQKGAINLTVQIAGREFEGEVKAWADDVVVMRNKRGRSDDTRRYY